MNTRTKPMILLACLVVTIGFAVFTNTAAARSSRSDEQKVAHRGDVRFLPAPLTARLVKLAGRPHTYLPLTVFSEANSPSQFFQYYLLDTTGFQPNVFTTTIPGLNDGVAPTATGPNGDLPTIGAVRVVLEPKPGLPTDPNDPGAFIDMFTDISGLFVINNESGWYEGWMIHDVVVPPIAPPRSDHGGAQFGTMTQADANALAIMGSHNNVPGQIFTRDGNAVHFPSPSDPDRGMVNNDDHKEKRLRFIPSGLANEILLDVYVRVASFEPGMLDKEQRLFDAYAKEVARVDQNGDGIVDAVEADLEGTSDNPPQSNDRLFILATQFNRLAVTREINDGLLAPRFAPSQRAWVLSGTLVPASPAVNASIPQDADNR